MSKRSVWLTLGTGLAVIVLGVWLGGRMLWAKFLEMHGMAPHSARTATTTWPSTDAGTIARGWVEAFNAGEPAMRAFLAANMAPQSLAERNVDQRMETYRASRERFRTLRLTAIGASSQDRLEATLTAADGSKHDFTFETKARKLTAVSRLERRHQHH